MDRIFHSIALSITDGAIAYHIIEIAGTRIFIAQFRKRSSIEGNLRTRRGRPVCVGKASGNGGGICACAHGEGGTREVCMRFERGGDGERCEDHAGTRRVMHPLRRIADTAAGCGKLRRIVEGEGVPLIGEDARRCAAGGGSRGTVCDAIVIRRGPIFSKERIRTLAHKNDDVARAVACLIANTRTGARLGESDDASVGKGEGDGRRAVEGNEVPSAVAGIGDGKGRRNALRVIGVRVRRRKEEECGDGGDDRDHDRDPEKRFLMHGSGGNGNAKIVNRRLSKEVYRIVRCAAKWIGVALCG